MFLFDLMWLWHVCAGTPVTGDVALLCSRRSGRLRIPPLQFWTGQRLIQLGTNRDSYLVQGPSSDKLVDSTVSVLSSSAPQVFVCIWN